MTSTTAEPDLRDDADRNLLGMLDRAREQHGTVTRSCRYRCASGERFAGKWRGVRIGGLVEAAPDEQLPPETTHLRAVSADGYCVPVAILDALDAVVATERLDGEPEGLPRLVGEGLDGPWTARDLVRLEPAVFPASAEPEPTYIEEVSAP